MMKNRCNPSSRRSPGHTIAECLVAFAMLMPIAILVSKVASQTEQASRNSVLASQALRDLMSAREEIGSWEYTRVSSESIQSISFLDSPAFPAASRELQSIVEEVDEPIASKRVSLSLRWSLNNAHASLEIGPITFWIAKP